MQKKLTLRLLWQRNHSSVGDLTDKVLEALHDQSRRAQTLKKLEQAARAEYPALSVASLGALKKDMPNVIISARVLLDGTDGISVHARTRIPDQDRAPLASDVKRVMREGAPPCERTFALRGPLPDPPSVHKTAISDAVCRTEVTYFSKKNKIKIRIKIKFSFQLKSKSESKFKFETLTSNINTMFIIIFRNIYM